MKPTKPPKTKREKWEALQQSLTKTNHNFMVPLEPKKEHSASKFAAGIFRTI